MAKQKTMPKAPTKRKAAAEGAKDNRATLKSKKGYPSHVAREIPASSGPPKQSAASSAFESPDPTATRGAFPLRASSRHDVNGRSESADAKSWAALPGGTPNPRQRAQRGENVVSPAATADAGGGLTVPAPIE
jgi:hypothetical protein